MIPTIERNGRVYVSASALAVGAEIVVKNLPGQPQIVACSKDRCAVVRDFLRDGNETLVSVAALAEALGAAPRFSEGRQHVRFEVPAPATGGAETIARVGQLAPNFRLTKLDGSPVALSDFRGKRVLINSWASW